MGSSRRPFSLFTQTSSEERLGDHEDSLYDSIDGFDNEEEGGSTYSWNSDEDNFIEMDKNTANARS